MEDMSTMTPAIVIGKIVAFEMSRKMGQEEASSSSKGKALACGEKKKMKGKQVETSSSSSSSSEDEEEDEDDDDDDEDSSEDDQFSTSTFDLDEESIILPPFLNISHIVFSTNINARLGEGCETEKKKKNQAIFSLLIRLLPKSKGLVGACVMYGGKISKLIGMGANTYLYFENFFRNLYSLY